MVDSHCHLADDAFADDLEEVIRRALDGGLEEALCIVDACDHGEMARLERIRGLWPALRSTAGVHPHRAAVFAERAADAAATVRARLAADDSARAVGEIGLDYHYDLAPRQVQRDVFEAQVALARELALPVVIHTREADQDTVAILRAAGGRAVTGVFHCFSGGIALARQALDLGFFVSFSGIVTFPKAAAVREAARFVPDDRLLIETDCPYLAPVPNRGRRNEPSWVIQVGESLAIHRQASVAALAGVVTANYRTLFAP